MAIIWTQSARADLFRLADFFDDAQPRRGDLLLSAVGEAIERAAPFANSGSPLRDGVRRKLNVRKFPVLVPYRVDQEDMLLLRVVHNRSDWECLL